MDSRHYSTDGRLAWALEALEDLSALRLSEGVADPVLLRKGGNCCGPDGLQEALAEADAVQRREIVNAVLESGYPDHRALQELRAVVAEPMPKRVSRATAPGAKRRMSGKTKKWRQ